jgi:hypothetical protein
MSMATEVISILKCCQLCFIQDHYSVSFEIVGKNQLLVLYFDQIQYDHFYKITNGLGNRLHQRLPVKLVMEDGSLIAVKTFNNINIQYFNSTMRYIA